MTITAAEIERAFETREPTLKDIVKEMLRDYRFKRKILSQAEHIFDVLSPEEKKQLFKETLKEILQQYKIKDIKELYQNIRWEVKESF